MPWGSKHFLHIPEREPGILETLFTPARLTMPYYVLCAGPDDATPYCVLCAGPVNAAGDGQISVPRSQCAGLRG